jgi:uncharacterized membrane protein
MACGAQYGVTLILFYLTGSRVTRVGAAAKAKLEDGYREGGCRTAAQARACKCVACRVLHMSCCGLCKGTVLGHGPECG